MKVWSSAALLTLGLALAVWVLFYVVTPGTPLTPQETVLVVGVCALVVLLGKTVWTRFWRTRGRDEEKLQ